MTAKQTETDKTSIAVINTNIQYIQKDVAAINANIKEIAGVYATREALIEVAKDTQTRLARLEESSNLWRWISPSLAAILGSVLTFLIIQYLMHIGGK